MGNDSQTNGGREVKMRWSLIRGPRVWVVLLAIAVTHVGASGGKKISSEMRMTRRSNITIGERVCNAPECYQVAKFVNDSIDYTVDPCDDFYHYACGRWSENHPIPIGDSFYNVQRQIEDKIDLIKRRIIGAGIVNINGVSRDILKIPYDVYHSCMNTTAVENVGSAVLNKLIQEMGNWTMVEENGDWNESNWDFAQVLSSIHHGYSSKEYSLFNVKLFPNPNNRSRFAITIDQTRLPLPESFYLNSGAMDWYKGFIMERATMLGGKINISEKAQDLVEFEAKLANISIPHADRISREMTIKELQDEAPNFPWLNHLNSVFAPERLDENETIYVRSLPYLKKFMAIVLQTPKSVLANYLVANTIWEEKDYLPMRRQETQRERLKRCFKSTIVKLAPDIFSALYIHDNLTKYVQIKEKVKVMTAEIHKSFNENVKSLSWLDNITKNAVIEKNDFMAHLLMFPDYYLNGTHLAKRLIRYNNVVTRKDTFHSNAIAIRKAKHRSYLKNLRRTNNEHDRLERLWEDENTAAFIPNYYFTHNRLLIPAGLVQTPVYYERDNDYLRSINLGSLGCYIGHEITHGFGKRGSSYDKYGMKTSNMWTPTSMAAVIGKVGCIINQYSQYKINGTFPIDFQRTVEEDIADNGALKAALKAYYDWSKKNPNDTWRLPGLNFTNEQLFFFGFARNMCTNFMDLKQRLRALRRSPHTDPQYRVIGVLSNSLEFANAFNCPQNSPMNPAHKCTLWSKEESLAN